MASILAVVAASDRYSYMWDGRRVGVVLDGRLGSVAAWDDGTIIETVNQAEERAYSSPYWACYTGPCMDKARDDFALYAKL